MLFFKIYKRRNQKGKQINLPLGKKGEEKKQIRFPWAEAEKSVLKITLALRPQKTQNQIEFSLRDWMFIVSITVKSGKTTHQASSEFVETQKINWIMNKKIPPF